MNRAETIAELKRIRDTGGTVGPWLLRDAIAALEDAEGDALTADERAECDIESHYGRSKTGLHIDHKGRMFARDDRNVVVLNEAADAVMFLAKVAALVQIQRAAIDRARGG